MLLFHHLLVVLAETQRVPSSCSFWRMGTPVHFLHRGVVGRHLTQILVSSCFWLAWWIHFLDWESHVQLSPGRFRITQPKLLADFLLHYVRGPLLLRHLGFLDLLQFFQAYDVRLRFFLVF